MDKRMQISGSSLMSPKRRLKRSDDDAVVKWKVETKLGFFAVLSYITLSAVIYKFKRFLSLFPVEKKGEVSGGE